MTQPGAGQGAAAGTPLPGSGPAYPPPSPNVEQPTPARIYDYLLDGKDNFAVDRRAAEALVSLLGPETAKNGPQENRAFVLRAVRWMAQQGVRQFVDLGAGLPTTQGTVHEVARQVHPEARVLYVDHDPVVMAHGRALLADSPGVDVITADLRKPADVFGHPVTRGLIDLELPVGLLLFAVLHFVPDEQEPGRVLRAHAARLPPGSFIGISHVTGDGFSTETIAQAAAVYQRTGSVMVPRSRGEIAAILDGFDLVEPGLVPTWEWRPDPTDHLRTNAAYAAVARIGR